MHCPCTAILQLRRPDPSLARGALPLLFRPHRGVGNVEFKPDDSLVTVCFDGRLTDLAEIVRAIEDGGSVVASVAQRRVAPIHAPAGPRPTEAACGSAGAAS
ncbi:MAG: heavy-metal-associated domain-containing protein [Planctomycetota bacterium]|nr:heavy-metal-associated domain-containing protein [Planctomycetota bacterium]